MTIAEMKALLGPLPQPAAPALVVDIVTGAFEQLGDPDNVAGIKKFIPGVEEAYGLRVAQLRNIAKVIYRAYEDDVTLCRSIALASWPRATREHRLFTMLLLELLPLEAVDFWKLGVRYLEDAKTWEDVDQLCSSTLGQALCLDPAYINELEDWIIDDNFWVRRAAVVSMIMLRRATYPEAEARLYDQRALAMCYALLHDKEHYVRKAVDWTIREILKRRYDLARDWLFKRAAEHHPTRARTVLKWSTKKLTEADREHFMAVLEAAG